MENQQLAKIIVLISLTALNVAALNDLGYSIEKYDESPGIYFESKCISILYSAVWRNIAYVNLNKIDNETLALRQYVHHVDMLCQVSIIRNWTGCAHFSDGTRDRLNQLTKTKFMKGNYRATNWRQKKEVGNFQLHRRVE
jgi:hypothetical protein